MNFIISQILGMIVSVAAIASMQMKGVVPVLVCQLVCNTLGAVSYILVGGLSGCGIYFVALLQTIIYFVIRQKEKNAPAYLAIIFVFAFLSCSVTTYQSPYDIFSAVAAVTCALALSQEKASAYRLFMLANGLIWVVYDVSVGAYTMIISHAVTAVSALVGIVRLDMGRKA